ncbi:hypothetical protein BV898_04954 [Hypsibius exemplaris]|uniref:Uncharacterized protein n=1 Tax=Hypsibius exemplaris TaxID=2072580 RepID=A0A1W0X162_HYPEX|nr:hypothetical protein BV898_04954 [Hypsibius exemplaris]
MTVGRDVVAGNAHHESPALPDEITRLPRHKTACKYCGISYLMFRELTVLREKLEAACKALSGYDPRLASELLHGEPASLCKTQEDMQSLRSSFFSLRQFVQQTFHDIQLTARQFEQTVVNKSQFVIQRLNKKHKMDLETRQSESATAVRAELDLAQQQLVHMQRHLAEVTMCRDDLARVSAEMEGKMGLLRANEQTLMQRVDVCAVKMADDQIKLDRMQAEVGRVGEELQEQTVKCEVLRQALAEEVQKVKVASREIDAKESGIGSLKRKVAEQEDQPDRSHCSLSETSDQTRATTIAVKLLIARAHEPIQAQMDRVAVLTRFLTASNAALHHLRHSVAVCKTKLASRDEERQALSPIVSKDDHGLCRSRMAEQQQHFAAEISQCREKNEADISRCGKRLNCLKSEFESLQKKTSLERVGLECQITNLQMDLESERTRHTLQLSKSAEACAELSALRMTETARADAAEKTLQEQLTKLDNLQEKIGVLTTTISAQKAEMDHLLQVVKCQCEERLELLKKLGKPSRHGSVNGDSLPQPTPSTK